MPQKRYLYFDVLSCFACLAVLFLHCNGIVHTYVPSHAWAQALFVEVTAYWAVPVFFMLTGAKTLNYRNRHTTKDFLIARFWRIVVPFLIWSVILFIVRFGILGSQGLAFTPGGFLQGFMTNTIEPTYWFFFAIMALTFSIPVLSRLTKHPATLWYLVICYLVLNAIIPTVFQLAGLPWNSDITISAAGGYICYAVLGYLLAFDADRFLNQKRRIAIYAMGIGSLVARYLFTYFASTSSGELVTTLFNYNSIIAFLPAAAVFILAKQSEISNRGGLIHAISGSKIKGAFTYVSSLTFGIYLIHKLFLDNFLVGIIGIPMESGFMRLVCPLLLFGLCASVVAILKRIPLFKAIVP